MRINDQMKRRRGQGVGKGRGDYTSPPSAPPSHLCVLTELEDLGTRPPRFLWRLPAVGLSNQIISCLSSVFLSPPQRSGAGLKLLTF